MNNLTLHIQHPSPLLTSIIEEAEAIAIHHKDENWSISADTSLEEPQIIICLPNGLVWTGTIYCFEAIHTIVSNARKEVSNQLYNQGKDIQDESLTTLCHLDNLLAHFSNTGTQEAREPAKRLLSKRNIQDKIKALGDLALAGGHPEIASVLFIFATAIHVNYLHHVHDLMQYFNVTILKPFLDQKGKETQN